jgi:TM2 domain-containing membrane protein YozV
MFCRNCGNEIDDKAFVCVKCGVRPNDGTAHCQVCGKETQPGAVVCVHCGAQLAASGAQKKAGADKKIIAGVCGILLGALGVHKFVLGYTPAGIIMLAITIVTCGALAPVVGIIGLIEGIIYLCKPDDEFVRTYVDNEKQWF